MKDCQCCIGVETTTPATVQNVPGLSSIVYRVGEHGSFFASMLAGLDGDTDFGLRTRETDDFSIALLDAAAIVCDILSFYQERFANEHYLRTAKERQSLVGIAQLSGYRLAPGRAAATYLAFTLESAVIPPTPAVPGLPPGPYPKPGAVEGVPSSVIIPAGTKVQSVPGPGETPQIFESIEDIVAKPRWNSIPLRARAYFPSSGTASFNQLELAGFVSSLKQGDFVLVKKGGEDPKLHQVASVDGQIALNRTIVTFREGSAPSAVLPASAAPPTAVAPAAFDDSYVASAIRHKVWNQPDLETIADARRWDTDSLEQSIRASQAADTNDLSVIVMGNSAALFGHNARDYTASGELEILNKKIGTDIFLGYNIFWDTDGHISDQSAGTNAFYLDNTNPWAVPGRWVVLQSGTTLIAGIITDVAEVSVSRFDLRSRVTKVTLGSQVWLAGSAAFSTLSLRGTRVLIETTRASAALPAVTLVSGYADAGGDTLLLDGPHLGLKPGRTIVVTGEISSLQGQTGYESATIAEVRLDDGYTILRLSSGLANRYTWATASVLANTAAGSHGETVQETLGAGDATVPFQRFALKQTPLTYVSAVVPGGIMPAITVRVNGVEWKLVDNLYAAGPQDRVYTLQTTSDGTTWVVFGDGTNGARLPSGPEAVTATYRRGIGNVGNLDAGQLSMALSRPLGLNSVVNPVVATGGGDPETLEESRISLPFPLRTLGRIVTLEDYEDFARASAGVAKSSAQWIWDGHRWVALVTIAGPDGQVIPPHTPAFDDLLGAMQAAGDPHIPSALTDYRPVFFDLDASLTVDPDYVADTVLAGAKQNLRAFFGFNSRTFLQPVFLSEVITVLQNTLGVIAVDLNALYFSGTTPDLMSPPNDSLTAEAPYVSGSSLLGAQLLTLDRGPLNGVRVKS